MTRRLSLRAVPLLLWIVAIGAMILLALGSASAAPAPCSVEASVDTKDLRAHVTSTSAGAVSTTGTVQITKPAVTRAVVSLTATISTGWVVTVSPSSITVSEQASTVLVFSFTSVVPPATLAETVGVATIAATMIMAGYQCTPSQVEGITITPLPYFDELSARVSSDAMTIREGGRSGRVWILVTAKVNTPIVLELNYAGPASVTFVSPRFANLQPNETSVVTANVTLSANSRTLTAGVYQMFINISASTESGATKSGTLALPLLVEPPPPITAADVAVPVAAAAIVGVAAFYLIRRRRAG